MTKWTSIIFVVLLTLSVATANGQAPVKRTVTETRLTEVDQKPTSIWISPDGRHVALIIRQDKKATMFIDGVPGQSFGDIELPGDLGPPFGKPAPTFSADSKRYTYIAVSGSKKCLVVDGKCGEMHDEITDFGFSPDSRHVFYLAKTNVTRVVNGKKVRTSSELLYIDGKPLPDKVNRVRYGLLSDSLVFEPNGDRIAIVVTVDPASKKEVANEPYGSAELAARIWDGEKLIPAGRSDLIEFVFTPQQSRVSMEWTNKGSTWVIDGRRDPTFSSTDDFMFGTGGQHYAYVANVWIKDHLKYAVVTDGKPGIVYDSIDDLHLSPDGLYVAYRARTKFGVRMVIDSVEGPEMAYIRRPVFDQATGRVAYQAFTKSYKSTIILDGKQVGGRYSAVGDPVFVTGTSHIANVAMRSGRMFVVIDGTSVGREYADIYGIPEIDRYRIPETRRYVFSDQPNSINYLAYKKDEITHQGGIYLVEERIE